MKKHSGVDAFFSLSLNFVPVKRNLHKLVILCLGIAALFGSVAADQGKSTLRIASWNVQNYLIMDRYLEGIYRPEYPKPESEKNALRAAIHAVQPDILLLQEIGGSSFLEELRQDLSREGSEFPYAHTLKAAGQPRALGVLSRKLFTDVELILEPDFPYFETRSTLRRGLMRLALETDGIQWTLFNVHLKSRLTERDDDPGAAHFKEREARAARDAVRSRYDTHRDLYLILGDFNDTINSPPLQRFLELNKAPLNQEIELFDSQETRWTYHEQRSRSYQQVDFALASLAWEKFGALPRGWIYEPPLGTPHASDHRMFVVEIDFKSVAR